jgi:hypothetical protein
MYQVRVRVTGKLPEGLEIVTWKDAKKRNRTARIRRDSKWLPAPSEGKPILGVRTADESEADWFGESNWRVLSELKSAIIQSEGRSDLQPIVMQWGGQPTVQASLTLPGLPHITLIGTVDDAKNNYTDSCADLIEIALDDAETLTKRVK